jgi:hypothetical protein
MSNKESIVYAHAFEALKPTGMPLELAVPIITSAGIITGFGEDLNVPPRFPRLARPHRGRGVIEWSFHDWC